MLTGKGIPVLAAMLCQQALVIGYGAVVLGLSPNHLPLLALALLCWTPALIGLGTALGALARSQGELSAAYDIGGMLLSSLGGALVPLSALPPWVRTLAPASPGYWAMSSLHAALSGDSARTLTACAVLLCFALAFGLLAALRLRHGSGRSARL